MKETLFGERFSRASWIGVLVLAFAQLTGINAVIFYSSEIFKDTGMSVFTATGIIYSVNMLAAVGSIFLLSFVGKRWTMICA